MTQARKHLVCLSDTPYYHVTSRCVRRAFLCGKDAVSGKSYEHRRDWIEHRLRFLSSVFAIDIAAYAVMSNHYHLVVTLRGEQASDWSEKQVFERWTRLYRGPLLVQRYRKDEPLSEAERATLASVAAVYRERLKSLSWFMKCLNEPIARRANAEDDCSGHFWEARFHSQALCSEQALITAMAYVDLNPVRAGIARTPEASAFTSVRARIKSEHPRTDSRPVKPLQPFADQRGKHDSRSELPITWPDYLTLVDATGRFVVGGKRGRIDPSLKPVLERLGLSWAQWFSASTGLKRHLRVGQLRLNAAR